jgi:hypothetical protein
VEKICLAVETLTKYTLASCVDGFTALGVGLSVARIAGVSLRLEDVLASEDILVQTTIQTIDLPPKRNLAGIATVPPNVTRELSTCRELCAIGYGWDPGSCVG